MRFMAAKTAILAVLVVVANPVFAALHLMSVISIDEFVHRRLTQPEDQFSLFRFPPSHLKHIQFWVDRLVNHKYLPILGPCRPSGPINAPRQCRAPPYPFFPLTEVHRNKLLMRPPPDVVRANIQLATKGQLSTVDELVERVNAALKNLNALGDNELTLLATNFHQPEAGLTLRIGCGPINYDGVWPEDMLVSQDEQRAILAAYFYLVGDGGYLARRDAALVRAFRSRGLNPEFKGLGLGGGEEKALQAGTCYKTVLRGVDLFQERVKELDKEVLIPEREWVFRYVEYVAAMRAEFYAMVPRGLWDEMAHRVDEMVSASEDVVGEDISRNIPMDDNMFFKFWAFSTLGFKEEYRELGLGDGILKRIGWRRWMALKQRDRETFGAPWMLVRDSK